MNKNKLINKYRQHTIKRLIERYDMDCTERDLSTMKKLIKSRKSICIDTYSHSIKLHLIKFKSHDIVAMYNKRQKEIVTVYPPLKSEIDDPYPIYESAY